MIRDRLKGWRAEISETTLRSLILELTSISVLAIEKVGSLEIPDEQAEKLRQQCGTNLSPEQLDPEMVSRVCQVMYTEVLKGIHAHLHPLRWQLLWLLPDDYACYLNALDHLQLIVIGHIQVHVPIVISESLTCESTFAKAEVAEA